MINILGFKRVMILLVLFAINVMLGAVVYMYLQPEIEKTTRTLASEKASENEVRNDLADIELEFAQLETQRGEFEILRQRGFFSNQSRRQAEAIFLEAKLQSEISEAIVSVKPGKVVEDEIAAKADHVLLESEIEIDFKAIDDIDVLAYISYLEKYFPGHLSITMLSITRKANISDTILRAIASGASPGLVEGKLVMIWRTMVSRADYLSGDATAEQNEGGF